MKRIAIGSDHIGLNHKRFLIEKLTKQGYHIMDMGTFDQERTDYPIYAHKVAQAINTENAEAGILICGTGVGISIAANKIAGIRCALCADEFTALMCREHNNANIIAFGANIISPEKALALATLWLNTAYDGGRHQKRLDMIAGFERVS
ncbi:ribose 5-phosphate isomerase B [Conservatibacter flavescens]|uniref:Ribose 5-phosphate isomerase B n=2 Tax=Conservatibacter flavescens TaxID=28161 RepID=A0A2M8S2E8_9PAST|nr:ribose 5-phosphate isomerase B [Conservatibacter flavescens]